MDIQTMPTCAVETTCRLLNDPRKTLILRELKKGTHRFGELQKAIHCSSSKTLTKSLREMEDDLLVSRHVFAEVPPRVEYTLTDTGEIFLPVLEAMRSCGKQYQQLVEETCR